MLPQESSSWALSHLVWTWLSVTFCVPSLCFRDDLACRKVIQQIDLHESSQSARASIQARHRHRTKEELHSKNSFWIGRMKLKHRAFRRHVACPCLERRWRRRGCPYSLLRWRCISAQLYPPTYQGNEEEQTVPKSQHLSTHIYDVWLCFWKFSSSETGRVCLTHR